MSELMPWAKRSRVLDVTLAVAGQAIGIPHGLDRKPDGFLLVWSDGPVYAGAVSYAWDAKLAFLRPANADTHALVVFYVLSEDVHVP